MAEVIAGMLSGDAVQAFTAGCGIDAPDGGGRQPKG